jgi:hypothetical protein
MLTPKAKNRRGASVLGEAGREKSGLRAAAITRLQARKSRQQAPSVELVPMEAQALFADDWSCARGYMSSVYFLRYGRRSWHSAWGTENEFTPASFSFELDPLKHRAEALRAPGMVFQIEALPMLILHCADRAAGIAPLNDRSGEEYDMLLAALGSPLGYGLAASLPGQALNWLLNFDLDQAPPRSEQHPAQLLLTISGGTPHRLTWEQLTGKGRSGFTDFAGAILQRLSGSAAGGAGRKRAAGFR